MPIVAQSTASAQSESSIPLPPLLLSLLAPYLTVLLAWLGEQLLAHVRRTEADHPLFQIDRHLDLAPVVTACAAYQHTHGPGAPPTFPLATLVRAEIVRASAESCSSPALAQHLRSNLVVRAFVGLPLFGPSPSPSTLDRFHAWLCRHQPDTLFRHVLRFLDQVDPEDPATTPQIIDTFGMHAPAAAQSPLSTIDNYRVFARWETPRTGPHPPTPSPVQPGATSALRCIVVIPGASLTGEGGAGHAHCHVLPSPARQTRHQNPVSRTQLTALA